MPVSIVILALVATGLAAGAAGAWRRSRRLLILAATFVVTGVGLAAVVAIGMRSM